MTRTVGAALVVVSMVIGFTAAHVVPEMVVSAQAGWQCTSWTLYAAVGARNDRPQKEDVVTVGVWLSQARSAQIATASVDVAGLYALVAYKQ